MSSQYKYAVAQRFSAAATSYDRVAHLQRQVGKHLITNLPSFLNATHIMDLGAGTGYGTTLLQQRFPQSQYWAVDLAEGMLRFMRQNTSTDAYICADMEQLPFGSDHFDLIVSNLAVQWSLDFARSLEQCFASVRTGGIMRFSTVLEGSLKELKQSWAAVDDYPHVNRFRTHADYISLCQKSPWQLISAEQHRYRYFYEHVKHLRQELRELGANHLHGGRKNHHNARQRWQQLLETYESYRTPNGLPATWDILYITLQKP
ncbi:malonyl-ACP O-methyltransferase BioC [Paenalcaligenes hominis]|uniref:malonyl-ACP O-methyltransferase BioC n=1 Tax=Paenalcaligenes hominis TaxID=643674 RepID=UPI00352343CC